MDPASAGRCRRPARVPAEDEQRRSFAGPRSPAQGRKTTRGPPLCGRRAQQQHVRRSRRERVKPRRVRSESPAQAMPLRRLPTRIPSGQATAAGRNLRARLDVVDRHDPRWTACAHGLTPDGQRRGKASQRVAVDQTGQVSIAKRSASSCRHCSAQAWRRDDEDALDRSARRGELAQEIKARPGWSLP